MKNKPLTEKEVMSQTVPPSLLDPPKAGETLKYAVIGEAPGEFEQYERTPFVGQSGKLIRGTFNGLGYPDRKVLYTNVVNVRPEGNRDLTNEEILEGRERLKDELLQYRPERILLCGGAALNAIFGGQVLSLSIKNERGLFRDCTYFDHHGYGPLCFATYHPAMILREPSAFVDFSRDVRTFLYDSPKSIPRSDYRVPQNWGELRSIIAGMLSTLPQPWVFSLDIETSGFNPDYGFILSIGITFTAGKTIIIPDSLLKTPHVIRTLQNLFDNHNIKWITHNGIIFDAQFMWESLKLNLPRPVDTMFLHYIMDERPGSQGLKQLVRDYYAIPDYSKPVKKYLQEEGTTFADIPREELYTYQTLDCELTRRLYLDLEEELASEEEPDKLRWCLDNVIYPGAEMIAEITRNGITIDVPHLQEVEKEWSVELASMDTALRNLVGRDDFNPASVPQLRVHLYETLKLPRVWLTDVVTSTKPEKETDVSTCEKVLERIKPYDKTGFIDLLLERRKLGLFISTFVRGIIDKVEPDGKVRPRLLIHGTETGRLASRNPNIQNIPKHDPKKAALVRYGFCASPGYKLVEFDFSQLEFRAIAWMSQDPGLIAAFRSGHDFHSVVAMKANRLSSPEEVTELQRFYAKKVNFGILYQRGAKALAQTELKWMHRPPESNQPTTNEEAQVFIDSILNAYPGLRTYFADVEHSIKTKGYVETPFGRRRRFLCLSKSNYHESRREAINSPIQSMASDICLLAAVDIHRDVMVEDEEARLLFLIHDSIMAEIREDLVDTYVPKVLEVMTHPKHLEDRGVPWEVKYSIMDRWAMKDED